MTLFASRTFPFCNWLDVQQFSSWFRHEAKQADCEIKHMLPCKCLCRVISLPKPRRKLAAEACLLHCRELFLGVCSKIQLAAFYILVKAGSHAELKDKCRRVRMQQHLHGILLRSHPASPHLTGPRSFNFHLLFHRKSIIWGVYSIYKLVLHFVERHPY